MNRFAEYVETHLYQLGSLFLLRTDRRAFSLQIIYWWTTNGLLCHLEDRCALIWYLVDVHWSQATIILSDTPPLWPENLQLDSEPPCELFSPITTMQLSPVFSPKLWLFNLDIDSIIKFTVVMIIQPEKIKSDNEIVSPCQFYSLTPLWGIECLLGDSASVWTRTSIVRSCSIAWCNNFVCISLAHTKIHMVVSPLNVD